MNIVIDKEIKQDDQITYEEKLRKEIYNLWQVYAKLDEKKLAPIYQALNSGSYDKNRFNLSYKKRFGQLKYMQDYILLESNRENDFSHKNKKTNKKIFEDASNFSLLINDLILLNDINLWIGVAKTFPDCPLLPILATAVYGDDRIIKNPSYAYTMQKYCPMYKIVNDVKQQGYSYFNKFSERSKIRLNYYKATEGEADFYKLFEPYFESFFRQINNNEIDTVTIRHYEITSKGRKVFGFAPTRLAYNLPIIEVFENTGIFPEDLQMMFSNPKNNNLAALRFLNDNAKVCAEDKEVLDFAIQKLQTYKSQEMQ